MNEQAGKDEFRQAWEAQRVTDTAPSLAQLKSKARRAHRWVALRNALEYVAVLSVVVAAGAVVLEQGPLLMRFSALLMVAGMIYVLAQLHARASARKPPRDGTASEYLGFLQLELARQQRAARSAWRWYMLPFVPGTVVFFVASAVEEPEYPWVAMFIGFAILLIGVHLLNVSRARRIGTRLAALDSLPPAEAAPPDGEDPARPGRA
jgi:hypothetical protein